MSGSINEERRRLEALRTHAILDTGPEEAFDRITQLARDLFGQPIALISFIDQDRQWFKSKLGIDISEAPRESAFCHHTIQGTEPLVVPDARKDKRFRGSPLVKGEPGLRFYAGATIRDREGLALGTVCVLSPTVQTGFSERDRDALSTLAGIVANEMELRRQTVETKRESLTLDVVVRDMHIQLANSLRMVADVLNLQAAETTDHLTSVRLQSAATRVTSVEEVHRQLRRRHRGNVTALPSYLRIVVRGAWSGTLATSAYPYVEFTLPDTLDVPNDLAARIGLVAATLVLNAARARADMLYVLAELSSNIITLEVKYDPSPDGPPGYDPKGPGSGMRMIRALAGDNAVEIDKADPARVIVRFKTDEASRAQRLRSLR